MNQRLTVQLSNTLSNIINRMLLGKESYDRAYARQDQSDIEYWYAYQMEAEQELQTLGIHLAAPLE